MTHSYSELLEDSDYNFHSEGESMYEPFPTEVAQDDPEQQYDRNSSCFRTLHFAHPWIYLRKRIQGDLNLSDFPLPSLNENCEKRANNINARLRHQGPSIRRLIIWEFKCELAICCILVLMDFMVRLANSLLMGEVIRMLTAPVG